MNFLSSKNVKIQEYTGIAFFIEHIHELYWMIIYYHWYLITYTKVFLFLKVFALPSGNIVCWIDTGHCEAHLGSQSTLPDAGADHAQSALWYRIDTVIVNEVSTEIGWYLKAFLTFPFVQPQPFSFHHLSSILKSLHVGQISLMGIMLSDHFYASAVHMVVKLQRHCQVVCVPMLSVLNVLTSDTLDGERPTSGTPANVWHGRSQVRTCWNLPTLRGPALRVWMFCEECEANQSTPWAVCNIVQRYEVLELRDPLF